MLSYIAKQPILDIQQQIIAYELLFRDSQHNVFPDVNADTATHKIITEHILGSDINKLLGNKPCFINFTENALLKGLPFALIDKPIIIEVLEDVSPSPDVYNAIFRLKKQGFIIALDDFIYSEEWLPFFKLIDIIKFDIHLTSFREIQLLQPVLEKHNIHILIEKIETAEQFESAKQLNCKYFQGFLFAPPEVVLNEISELKLKKPIVA